ncbi:hypothetical protein [Cohnella lupini]|uniref:Uncharacterized protein n=1 Tax=Cohnella lupini TaxID=1294267 RepID=A0A3D9IWP5_9BACL|nr:hypothetical protein [Cohnella lupini]RED66125.1 hypothetical protein DFP95_101623 [Cohnella lupini]
MFENFNFKPGTVTYNPYKLSPDEMTDIKWLTEDMLQVKYPNNYIIDVGWYGKSFTLNGVFIIYIIKDQKWDNPVFKQDYRSVTELYEGMKITIQRITQLMNQ